jgi:hypothetical protein
MHEEILQEARSLSDIAFVTRRKRCDQMRGHRPGKTGGVFAGIHRGFFRGENDADGRRSFAAVERSMSDRLLEEPEEGERNRHYTSLPSRLR